MNPAIVVVGSLNMDFVVAVEYLPAPGETVLGRDFQMIPGGKGANQACAAGKLSKNNPVRMVGRVGYDLFADHLKASLSSAGVDVSGVIATRSQPTGVALIWVDKAGQNSIIVASGANFAFEPADVASLHSTFSGSGFVLFQLETPLPAVSAALAHARSVGAKTILDPAPAQRLDPALLAQVDILTPNETEARILLGRPPARVSLEDAPELAREVLALGARSVVLKLGDQGCFYTDGSSDIHAAAFPVEAKDTTAAGDTFNAALSVALSEGQLMEDALRFANAAAAISVTRMGAQASIPSRSEVDAVIAPRPLRT
jgi:ribokinase